jgi:hypothetical protein
VPVGHEDGAVGGDEDVVRLEEVLRLRPAGRSERHEQLAVRTELEDLVAPRPGGVGRYAGPGAGTVGDPDVALVVHIDAVWGDEHPGAERGDEVPMLVELEDGEIEAAQELAPQRSKTQMLLPSGSISTAEVDPHVRPAGILAQPSTVA